MEEANYTPTTRGSFLYCGQVLPSVTPTRNNTILEMNNSFHLQSNHNFLSPHQVKTEASSSQHARDFHYSLLSVGDHQQEPTLNQFLQQQQQQQQQQQPGERNHRSLVNDVDAIKAKIISHPQYSNLLEAYMECQKVGAPDEVVNRLTVIQRELEMHQKANMNCTNAQRDPELDQFMEAYCDMLVKYKEEISRPLQEAMEFMRRVEAQLKTLSDDPIRIDEKQEAYCSEDDGDDSRGETELTQIDPRAEDRELKNHLLKKYSGYLSSLKQELSKKKKKGKLPKDARQKLLNWWELHYKWPYPSETEKVALAESTGLDQKQINNWFINQRKRHWKPSEDMQFVVMDGLHPQNAALYLDGHFMTDGNYRLGA